MKRGKFDTYDALFSHLLNYFTLGLNFNVGHTIRQGRSEDKHYST